MASLQNTTITGTLSVTGEATIKPPIGFVYIQFSGRPSPTTIWPTSTWPTITWTNISSTFAGGFFRVEGGNAAAWNESTPTAQTDLLKAHNHGTGTLNWVSLTGWGGASVAYGYSGICYSGGSAPQVGGGDQGVNDLIIDMTHSHTITIDNSAAGIENRPLNYTIRLWKRTA
jgi:hypothetical protein